MRRQAMEETSAQTLLESILERVKASAKVEVAFGEAKTVGDRTVIPVAAVAYGFGAGVGRGRATEGGEGSGGGGGVRVRPLGVIEIGPLETRFVPIIDWNRIIRWGMCLFFLMTIRR